MPVCSATAATISADVTEPKSLPSDPAAAVIVITFGTSVLAIWVAYDSRTHRNILLGTACFGLAVFTILFGTRSLDENERHYGVVSAIALEAVVKLTALILRLVFVAGIRRIVDI